MRIVFMGTPEFALPGLSKLAASKHEIVAVVTNPDKRRGRGGKKSPSEVKKKAEELQLPVITVQDLDDDAFIARLQKLEPDLLVVVAFRILPAKVLAIPKKGAVNLHASLLPKFRGAAPIHHAVMSGEKETGCTVFFIEKDVDTGKIIAKVKTKIEPDETTGELYNRLKELGSDLLLDAVDRIGEGDVNAYPQDHEKATPAPKLYKQDAKLDFTKSSGMVHNKIRGLSPFPAAWCLYDEVKMNIYKSEKGPEMDLSPGKMVFRNGKLLAGCGKGTVILKELQLPGSKIMSAKDFVNGYKLMKLK